MKNKWLEVIDQSSFNTPGAIRIDHIVSLKAGYRDNHLGTIITDINNRSWFSYEDLVTTIETIEEKSQ